MMNLAVTKETTKTKEVRRKTNKQNKTQENIQ